MKKSVLFITIAFNAFIISAANVQADPTRVSVTRFNQEVNHILDNCRGFIFDEQNQLQTELEHALTERGLKVLERRDIRNIYSDEYELPNLDQKTAPKKRKVPLSPIHHYRWNHGARGLRGVFQFGYPAGRNCFHPRRTFRHGFESRRP